MLFSNSIISDVTSVSFKFSLSLFISRSQLSAHFQAQVKKERMNNIKELLVFFRFVVYIVCVPVCEMHKGLGWILILTHQLFLCVPSFSSFGDSTAELAMWCCWVLSTGCDQSSPKFVHLDWLLFPSLPKLWAWHFGLLLTGLLVDNIYCSTIYWAESILFSFLILN